MRKRLIASSIVASILITQVTPHAYADSTEPKRAKTTAYTAGVAGTGTITASGKKVREGYIATNKKYLGCTAYIYKDEVDENGQHVMGELLGVFECEDTGGKGVQNGVIDVYRDNYDRCVEWMKLTNGYCWIQIIPAEG